MSAQHVGPGTNSRYNQGCRCDECTEAHAHYSRGAKHRRRRELLELRAHLAALKAKRGDA
jgi:hypothetical protein